MMSTLTFIRRPRHQSNIIHTTPAAWLCLSTFMLTMWFIATCVVHSSYYLFNFKWGLPANLAVYPFFNRDPVVRRCKKPPGQFNEIPTDVTSVNSFVNDNPIAIDNNKSDTWELQQFAYVATVTSSPLDDEAWVDACRYLALASSITHSDTSNSNYFKAIWDSGASEVITSDATDFVNGHKPPTVPLRLRGVSSSGTLVVGVGIVEYCFQADNGSILTIRMQAYYMPGSLPKGIRLIPPQRVCSLVGGSFSLEGDHATLSLPNKSPLTIPIDSSSNLPSCIGTCSSSVLAVGQSINLCVTDAANQNLTTTQKLLITWHYRFGHLNFKVVQWILRSGVFGRSPLFIAASKCEHPKCAACEYGKARRRPTKSSITKLVPERENALKTNVLFPGQRVSLDHFECSTKGRLLTSFGKTSPDEMYRGGAIFVDQASGYIYIQHQVTFSAVETLQAKLNFERMCLTSGVVVATYISDNGAFSAQDFVKDIADRGQDARYSGVGAHHHNGVAERAIQTISNMSRTMMLHAGIHWPDLVDSALWPMAMEYAAYIYNHTPNIESGQAPVDIFTRTVVPRQRLKDLHVWGCPTYVLEPKLQDGKKIPRWKPRSRRGVFLGLADKYASSIPYVLNPATGHISPQFHVIFDDLFTTVISQGASDLPPSSWTDLCITGRYQTAFDDNDPVRLDDEWLSSDELALRRHEDVQRRIIPPPSLPDPVVVGSFQTQMFDAPALPPPSDVSSPTTESPLFQREHVAPIASPLPAPTLHGPSSPQRSSAPILRERSTRVRSKPITFGRFVGSNLPSDADSYFAALTDTLRDPISRAEYLLDELQCVLDNAHVMPDSLSTFFVGLASKSDPDTLMYHEAMMAIDKCEFRDAMEIEIKGLELQRTWTLVPRTAAFAAQKSVLPSTWTFKRKRFPDGRIRKYKARFCVRGDKQVIGVDVFDTYAPVVQWSSVRLCFILSTILKLASRQVDYTNAFVQAYVKTIMYVELPKGFDAPTDNDYVLKLDKNLYGSRDAPLAWFETLKLSLEKRGFTASSIDPCLFIHKDMLVLCYVDDLIYVGPDVAKLDAMIADLSKEFQLTVEGDISSFLGIQIDTLPDNALLLTQSGLTTRVLEACLMVDCNGKDTPASTVTVGTDLGGSPHIESFSYASVIGMLMYLASNSRPDIAFAVHQCARFTHSPKATHSEAIKRICRYLKGTPNKGLIIRASKEFRLDVYVDSDFAGLWRQEDDQDPVCVKSRTGFVILLAGCPLLWQSKLQGQVALSTMEAEYIALSTSLRSLLPLKTLVGEVAASLMENSTFLTTTYSSVFEDNNGALLLAQSPRITPRSKHIAVPYHFFREHVTNGTLQILKVASEVNPADLFTKGLD